MGSYRHTKGIITDNALQALLHDPFFRPKKNRFTDNIAVFCLASRITVFLSANHEFQLTEFLQLTGLLALVLLSYTVC